MKPRLQTSLGQHLVLTPQLRQALHLLQLSLPELELEINQAVESNPLLEWDESPSLSVVEGGDAGGERDARTDGDGADGAAAEPWDDARDAAWDDSYRGGGGGDEQDGDASERIAQSETLRDHLLWQLNLSHLGPRELAIGEALVDAIDDDGYLREPLADIAAALAPAVRCDEAAVAAVLHTVQRMDPTGVGARDLGECLRLQLDALPADTPGREVARQAVSTLIERLARLGESGLADALGCDVAEAATALQLIRSLDPRPGARVGGMPHDTYVVPDCSISRHNGVWRVALAGSQARLTIHRGYEQMLQSGAGADAGYLRGRLQEARWLLKNLEARGETLLKVVRCLVREQSGFLEFGAKALRPLTLREVAAQIGMHESTVSRAVARKYVHTPRGTIPLRAFFASGIDTGGGGEASSIAIQDMIRRLVEAEDPRKPLSDARLAERLKDSGVPVARRTVAKYREALNIPSSHERVRIA